MIIPIIRNQNNQLTFSGKQLRLRLWLRKDIEVEIFTTNQWEEVSWKYWSDFDLFRIGLSKTQLKNGQRTLKLFIFILGIGINMYISNSTI